MGSSRETSPVHIGPAIPTIDEMFDEPDSTPEDGVSPEVLKRAHELAMPRVLAVCNEAVDPDDTDLWGIAAISDRVAYTTPQGTQLNLRLCVRRVKSPYVGDSSTHDGVGVIVESGTFSSRPAAIELFDDRVSTNKTTNLNTPHDNRPEDLRAFFDILHMFDGQGVFGT